MGRSLIVAAVVAWLGGTSPAWAQNYLESPPTQLNALNDCVVLDVRGMGSGTWTVESLEYEGTVSFTVASTNGSFVAVDTVEPTGPVAAVSSVSDDTGSFRGDVAGFAMMRACMTSYTSGSVIVTLAASSSGGGGAVSSSGATDQVEIVAGGPTQATTGTAGVSTGTVGICIWDDAVTTDTVTDGQNARLRCGEDGLYVAAIIYDPSTGEPADLTAEPCAVRANISSVVISTNTSANNLLVDVGAGQVLYPCGYDIIASDTVSVQFIAGTGTNCGTGEANLTGAYPLVANSGFVRDLPKWKSSDGDGDVGDDVCLELSAAVQVDGVFEYELITP